MSNKRKPRKPANPSMGMRPLPEVHWTPFEQTCGCVVDWGWDGQTSDPASFMLWCAQMVEARCPWHGAETGRPVDAPPDATIELKDYQNGRGSYFCRKATGDDVALGRRLAAELHQLNEKVGAGDKAVLLTDVPADYREQMLELGYDPAEAWFEQRLTDIVLNRGRSTLSNLLSAMREKQAGPGETD